MRVALCTPTPETPHPAYTEALAASLPALDAAGIEHAELLETGSPYISWARANLAHRAFRETNCEAVVYLDHDLSWRPDDLVRLILTPGLVVAGTYRFKKPEVVYMGTLIVAGDDRPVARDDGALAAMSVPAGFLKVTSEAYVRFARQYPQFVYGEMAVDLFNHGAHGGVWWGEDYAFSRNWRERCGDLWLVPDLDITHHHKDAAYPGNFARHLAENPGAVCAPTFQ